MIFDKTWRLQRIERKVAGLKAKLNATREIVNACERTVPGVLIIDMRDLPMKIAELEVRATQLSDTQRDQQGNEVIGQQKEQAK